MAGCRDHPPPHVARTTHSLTHSLTATVDGPAATAKPKVAVSYNAHVCIHTYIHTYTHTHTHTDAPPPTSFRLHGVVDPLPTKQENASVAVLAFPNTDFHIDVTMAMV